MFATVCPSKGADDYDVSRITSFVRDSGYLTLIFRSDHEPALRALLNEAFKNIEGQEEFSGFVAAMEFGL